MPESPTKGASPPLGDPERLGRYRLVRLISKGGMARVYEARRESLAGVAPRVALKVILPEHADNEDFQRLFVNEARVGSVLQHQNLVQIQDFDREGDRFFLVMEYVEGLTFRRILSLCKRNAMPVPAAVLAELGRQVCEGLFYAHSARSEDGRTLGLVHRDIKPSNLILNPQGIAQILDFGVSQAICAAGQPGGIRGTWGYMSPEQAVGGDVTGGADLWGVASVLYEMAAFAALFPSREPAKVKEWMAADEGARQAAALSAPYRQLAPVLVRALQRDPVDRYGTAMAMARALAERIPDPVSVREQVLQFQATVNSFQKMREGARGTEPPRSGRRSSSTFQVGSIDPYGQGIPVRAGNTERPFSPGEIAPEEPLPMRRRRDHTVQNVVLMMLALLVVGFTAWQIFGGEGPTPPPPPPKQDVEVAPPEVQEAPPVSPSPSGTTPPPQAAPAASSKPASKPSSKPQPAPTPEPAPALATEPVPVAEPTPVAATVPEPAPSDDPSPAPAPEVPTEPAAGPASGDEPGSDPVDEASPEPVAEAGSVPVAEAGSEPVDEASSEPVAAAPPAEPVEEAPAEGAMGLITVSSLPRSRVTLDGSFVKHTPLFQYELAVGRHVVVLETDDGRQTRFVVDVIEGTEVRRVWHFDQGQWIEQ